MLDLKKIKERLANLFQKGDKYIVIEILNHYVQVAVVRVSHKNKEITVLKSDFKNLPEFSLVNIFKEAKALLKKIPKINRYKIIFSLDSSLGATMYSSVSLIRSHPKETIDEADLDNLISQAIWRFFDKHRWKVARKMNVDDLDVLLSDVRIRDIKIDGHKIVNPLGFRAKAVEIFFSQTFIAREFLRGLRELAPKENIVFISEAGTALNHVLSKALEDDKFYVAHIFPNQTAVFASFKERLSHHDSFEWGSNDLRHSLFRHLRVDGETADGILQSYISENGSRGFLKRLENILAKELYAFSNGVESLTGEEKSDVYLNSFFNLPPLVYSARFHSRFQKPIKILPLSTSMIIEKLGYRVQFKPSAKIKNQLSLLGIILEAGFLPQNDVASHLANRRVRWLIN